MSYTVSKSSSSSDQNIEKYSSILKNLKDGQSYAFADMSDSIDALLVTDYLKELRDKGHAIILSTHIFSVAEELCDEIAVLIDGSIVAQGSVDKLIAQAQVNTFEEAFFKIYVENHKE